MNLTNRLLIIERLEQNDQSAAELNQLIAELVGDSLTTFPQYEPDGIAPNYTGDLGVACSLITRFCPKDFGFHVGRSSYPPQLFRDKDPRCYCEIWSVREKKIRIASGKHHNQIYAVLIAALRAIGELAS